MATSCSALELSGRNGVDSLGRQIGQLFADLPESLAGRQIVRPRRRSLLSFVLEVPASDVLHDWRTGKVQNGFRAAVRRCGKRAAEQGDDSAPAAHSLSDLRPYHTRVQAVRGDAGRFQAARQLIGEQHHGQFGLAICAQCRVLANAHQVIEIDTAHLFCCRCDVDDARRGTHLDFIMRLSTSMFLPVPHAPGHSSGRPGRWTGQS